MSRPKRDAQQLMHWCKNGDLVLKNKIKDTLLRENVHEEKFLDSTLSYLNKHQDEKQRHLVNKRLQFAKRRQRSLEKSELQHHLLEKHRSFSDGVLHVKGNQKSHKKPFNAKLKWQKAISVVRFAVQSKSEKKLTRLRPRAVTFLPSIVQPSLKSSPKFPRRNGNDNDHLVLPGIASATTERKNCLEDPRFLRLQQILSLDKNDKSGKPARVARKTSREEDGHGSRAARLRSQTFHL